ncbi:hypothetical protein ACFYNZ_15260 [Streptomyces kebangsaanensis]|uniref:Uncharacterized protein n=1 Tax=Streptomyces kebangsaanensis TaxID=864058 RepID=A0ABW6KSH4_9ACTN
MDDQQQPASGQYDNAIRVFSEAARAAHDQGNQAAAAALTDTTIDLMTRSNDA